MAEANPRVFFDITIGKQAGLKQMNPSNALAGRIVFELFKDIVPKTAEVWVCNTAG